MAPYKYLFGPLASRRLGRSLGVDLLTPKTCVFDCIYCEVGRTTCQTRARRSFAPPEAVLSEIEAFFVGGGKADFITFAGSGEPTLSIDLGYLIRECRLRFKVPVAVLTNGALLFDAGVRADLAQADLVMPSLDSALEDSFQAVNRPLEGIRVEDVISGLEAFSREFTGRLWLEILLVDGVNDSDHDLEALASALKRIQPERVQLNTVVRLPAEKTARPLARQRLEQIAARLAQVSPTEIIAPAPLQRASRTSLPSDEDIIETLKRRSCTVDDLAGGFGVSPPALLHRLEQLAGQGRIRKARFGHGDFYEALMSS